MENNLPQKNLLSFKSIVIFLMLLIIANLAFLNYVYFNDLQKGEKPQSISLSQTSQSQDINQTCSSSCLSEIYEATTSLKLSLETAPTKSPTKSSDSTSKAQEFFIPFGSGSSSAGDWEDVAGLKASIDTTKYPPIKTTVFEASVQIPTGNGTAYVRLYNETDKHPVWFSEVSLDGGTPQLLISKPITLDNGEKVYKVQMKTSLKVQTSLNQARVHITTK